MKTDMSSWILGGSEISSKVVQLQNIKIGSKTGRRKRDAVCEQRTEVKN
jgi:hypothetical protein